MRSCGSYCRRRFGEEGEIGVVGSRRDPGRIERGMASGERIDCFVGGKDRRNREDEGDATRLWAVGVAEGETRNARVPGTSVDRSQGCWMVAR